MVGHHISLWRFQNLSGNLCAFLKTDSLEKSDEHLRNQGQGLQFSCDNQHGHIPGSMGGTEAKLKERTGNIDMWSQRLRLLFPGTGQEHAEAKWSQSSQ